MAASDRPVEDQIADVGESLAEMAKTLFAAGSLERTLQATVDLAVETIDGCDYAGIFVMDGDVISTPVHSDSFVIDIDALQHRAGEGPCLDTITGAGTFYSGELMEDSRWPRFGPMANAMGIRSALAISLSANGVPGALNLYTAAIPRPSGSSTGATETFWRLWPVSPCPVRKHSVQRSAG